MSTPSSLLNPAFLSVLITAPKMADEKRATNSDHASALPPISLWISAVSSGLTGGFTGRAFKPAPAGERRIDDASSVERASLAKTLTRSRRRALGVLTRVA